MPAVLYEISKVWRLRPILYAAVTIHTDVQIVAPTFLKRWNQLAGHVTVYLPQWLLVAVKQCVCPVVFYLSPDSPVAVLWLPILHNVFICLLSTYKYGNKRNVTEII